MDRVILVIILLALAIPPARADLPLTIEDLLTEERRWRVDVDLLYANSDSSNVDSLYGTVQLGPSQFITIPISVGEARQNQDLFALSIGLRYGLSLDTELYGRISAISQEIRAIDADGISSDGKDGFSDAWFGLNHRLSKDDDTPALLLFAELALAESLSGPGGEQAHGKSMMAGLTTYRTIDPLVLSFTTGYQYTGERDIDGNSIDPGDLFFITPSVAFAVNNEITLTYGVQMNVRQYDRADRKRVGIRTTQTKAEMGMGYAWSKRTTLRLNIRFDISGDTGSEFGITWLYKIPGSLSIPHENQGGDTPKEDRHIH